MLKVLHCGAGNLFGGIESLLITLAQSRQDEGRLEPEFALCFEGRLSEELRATGVKVHLLAPARFSRPWTTWQARRRLRTVLADSRPDVVICHSFWPHALLGRTVRRAGLPLVFWMHNPALGDMRRDWALRYASRTSPDLAVANSHYSAESVPRLFPGAPTEVVPCPVPPSPITDRAAARADVRRELETPDDAVVVIQAARMERWKGQAILIEALGRLRDRPEWTAWIVGGGQRPHELSYLDELKASAQAAGIADRVKFPGQRRDVWRLLAAADIHCQPNVEPEPFGISYVEALYSSLPVIASDMGGASEILAGGNGILVPPRDSRALAGALARLMNEPETRRSLGSAGPNRARGLCAPEVILGRLHDLMAGLVRPALLAPSVRPGSGPRVEISP